MCELGTFAALIQAISAQNPPPQTPSAPHNHSAGQIPGVPRKTELRRFRETERGTPKRTTAYLHRGHLARLSCDLQLLGLRDPGRGTHAADRPPKRITQIAQLRRMRPSGLPPCLRIRDPRSLIPTASSLNSRVNLRLSMTTSGSIKALLVVSSDDADPLDVHLVVIAISSAS